MHKQKKAFTIVELLIVIIIVGVLAVLTFLSISGIVNRANIASVKSDLVNTSKQLQLELVTNGSYPTYINDINSGRGPRVSSNGTLIYQYDKAANSSLYCLTATLGGAVYSVTQSTAPAEGPCSVYGLVTSGMIANYDVANNSSFLGEPTTNQYSNSDFSSGLNSWSFSSWDSPSQYTKTTGTVMGPFGSPVTALIISRSTGTAASADFHQGNGGKYVSGQNYTLSAYVKGSGSINKSYQSGFTSSNAGTVNLTGDWQRVEYTVSSATSANYPFWAAANISQNSSLYFYMPQSENKAYSTPYVNGTRGSTYRTGGGLRDISGYGFNGELMNGPTYNSSNNGFLNFDGVDDYINISPSLLSDAQSGTVSMWFNRGAWTSDFETLFTKSNGAPWVNNHIVISRNNTTDYINLTISDNTNSTFASVLTPVINANQWYNIVMTWDGSVLIGYLNGAEIGRFNTSIKVPSNSTLVAIGKGAAGTGRYFAGKISNTLIYNKALTASEVTQNFNALKERYGL